MWLVWAGLFQVEPGPVVLASPKKRQVLSTVVLNQIGSVALSFPEERELSLTGVGVARIVACFADERTKGFNMLFIR